jgi:hypothetical protein
MIKPEKLNIEWIDINEHKPTFNSYDIPQSNGNTLTFYNEYLCKGYYNDNKDNVGVEYAAYKPGSCFYYFTVPRNFTVTHFCYVGNKTDWKNI